MPYYSADDDTSSSENREERGVGGGSAEEDLDPIITSAKSALWARGGLFFQVAVVEEDFCREGQAGGGEEL